MFNLIARILARPFVVNWIIKRFAKEKNVYFHITNPIDSSDVYMYRWWIIKRRPWMNFCVRLHHIKRADHGFNLHSHPFNYRTFILRNWYIEERPDFKAGMMLGMEPHDPVLYNIRRNDLRHAGETQMNGIRSFHRISLVHPEGVWTLFVMWGGKKGDWGFMTDDGYVQADEYFKSAEAR